MTKIMKEMKNMIKKITSAYTLTMHYMGIASEMDRLIEEKGKTDNETIKAELDKKYDELAEELFKTHEQLKGIKIL
jgi:phosphomevalonate kinase